MIGSDRLPEMRLLQALLTDCVTESSCLITERRSVAMSVGCFQRRLLVCVCVFVCLLVNTILLNELI